MPRKKPFSAKQKREQLKVKKERKRHCEGFADSKSSTILTDDSIEKSGVEGQDLKKINQQPQSQPNQKYDPNRYRLHFQKESQEEIDRLKQSAFKPYDILPDTALEVDIDEIYKPGSVLDMPKRPPWNYKMTKAKLEEHEAKYFKVYLDNILERYNDSELSYFESNLETWRQLWRVLEMSDVILLITDIRHPALHFSPTLYDYVTKELKKQFILILNKIDLAPPALVVAWKHYLQTKFPDLHIVCFTSFPKDKQEDMNQDPGQILHKKRRKKGSQTAVGPKDLLQVCEKIVQGQVELGSWKEKIEGDMAGLETPEVDIHLEEGDSSYQKHVQYKDGVLTIGCCGYPNVGKSSVMNGLVGRKVVSVSKTPGHTKHFQTIFLTPTVKLCDSPGLVFPSLVSKPMQILAGLFPVAQVREPQVVVGYLAQRIPLPRLLRLRHQDEDTSTSADDIRWSPFDICDAWADQRGFLTAKAARNDVYRAGNNILRMAVEGRLCMCTRPPGYTSQQEYWEKHPETKDMAAIQETAGNRGELYLNNEEEDCDTESTMTGTDDDVSDDDEAKSNNASNQNGAFKTSNPFALLGDDD